MQDVAANIFSFAQQRPRALCILSANGTVSAVTLRQPTSSGDTVTYEVHILDMFSFAQLHLRFSFKFLSELLAIHSFCLSKFYYMMQVP